MILERESDWVAAVPSLETSLVVPDKDGKPQAAERISRRFLAMDAIMEKPQVYFV